MREVHIYAEADSKAPKRMERGVGYLLETQVSGKTVTKEEFYREEATYHEAVMGAIAKALGRMSEPCVIHLHTQDIFVLGMIDGPYLEEWEKQDYVNSKGEPVKNADLWKSISKGIRGHLIHTEMGNHGYYNWMMSEMEHRFSA